jgi:8-oxo-dGTP diphosphatase
VPSGRVEPLEDSLETAVREAREEGGILLDHVQYIGCYQITERREVRWADCFASSVREVVDIQIPEESAGRRFSSIDELPEIYHVWNELTALVFQHSFEVVQRHQNGFSKPADSAAVSLEGDLGNTSNSEA